jgi:hypothetical protein
MIKLCTLADGAPPKTSLVYHHPRMAGSRQRGSCSLSISVGTAVSKADEFRQYAEEALRWAQQSKTEKEQIALIELARTWTQAAVQIEGSVHGYRS